MTISKKNVGDQNQEVFKSFEVPDPVRIRKVERFVRNYFKNLRGISVLECGVCKGGLTDMLRKEGADCFGIDLNPREIQGIKIYRADLNLGFPDFDRQFNLIFAGEVMEHLFDDEQFLRSCYKFLKPGGLLAITVPNLCFSINRLLILIGKKPMFSYAPYHYHIYTKKILLDLLEKNGFKLLKISSSHVLFSTRRYKIGKIFEILGDFFPSMGAHLIVYARKG